MLNTKSAEKLRGFGMCIDCKREREAMDHGYLEAWMRYAALFPPSPVLLVSDLETVQCRYSAKLIWIWVGTGYLNPIRGMELDSIWRLGIRAVLVTLPLCCAVVVAALCGLLVLLAFVSWLLVSC
ncbi:hypothetical protein TSUD_198250 [Trifolium subterraneum]|uniref:Uncharacterized protein n=1 Tax=Trifolium subterraneum TaxID=3900 RepID=A0A2Z6PPZ0_TRISU|nr:hypothetical protein TSUD_198250 [Trifolium subterraneum]